MPRPIPRNRNRRTVSLWPGWWYGPDGQSAIFQREEDVPEGWKNRPQQTFETVEVVPPPVKEDVIAKLQSLNITIDPRWGLGKLVQVLEEAQK